MTTRDILHVHLYPSRCNTLHGRSVKNGAQAPCACHWRAIPPVSTVLCRATTYPSLNITQVLNRLVSSPRSDPWTRDLPVSLGVGRFSLNGGGCEPTHGYLPGYSPCRLHSTFQGRTIPVIRPSSCPDLSPFGPTGQLDWQKHPSRATSGLHSAGLAFDQRVSVRLPSLPDCSDPI